MEKKKKRPVFPQLWSAAFSALLSSHTMDTTVCVYVHCVFLVHLCQCVCAMWTQSSGSSGVALYPRLILIYVKAMAHWRACTVD